MKYVDAKYVGLISSRLENFKKKTNTLYNFRCPICGDSEKNRYKARGYLYPSTDGSGFIFKCHNCGEVKSLAGLIKMLDHTLYQKYLLEGFGKKDKRFSTKASRKKKTPKISVSYLEKLGAERVDRIPKNHAVHKFINDRRIPDSSLDRLYYIHDDKNLEKIDPIYRDRIRGNQPRLILPFINREGSLVGIAARAINGATSLRYLAFRLDKTAPLIFGLDHIKRNSRDSVYVVEGPIDSLFLPNAIAVGGADFKKLESEIRKDKCIIIFDNEPRNIEIIKRMKSLINDGYNVCVWPQNIKEKDINDMVLSGIPPDKIQDMINKNTYSGLKAMTAFNAWKKVSI